MSRYDIQPATGTDWAVIDTVLDAIASGAESETMARDIAAEFEVACPDGIDVDAVA